MPPKKGESTTRLYTWKSSDLKTEMKRAWWFGFVGASDLNRGIVVGDDDEGETERERERRRRNKMRKSGRGGFG